MNSDDIHLLPFYLIPSDWTIHLINRQTDRKQLENIERIIENAQLFALDTETMPSFYHPSFQQNQIHQWRYDHTQQKTPSNLFISKPSLLQVAIRSEHINGKNVLLFDLQELLDQSNLHFRPYSTITMIHQLIQLILNHPHAIKISQSLFNDLAQLKCSYNDTCFQISKLHHCIELSDIFRYVFHNEKYQRTYGLQRMTAMTLHCQLDKKQQCANWSKRPLTQSLIDYAAMDVIVMIDIYKRLKTRIEEELAHQDEATLTWEHVQTSIETSIDLNKLVVYSCSCGERFMTNKTRNKHARTCIHEQQRIEQRLTSEPRTTAPMPKTDLDAQPPRGRGYIPPALKRAFESINRTSFYEQVRCSSAFETLHQYNENRPPDAQYFLEDDDTEVAQAFGLQITHKSSNPKRLNPVPSRVSKQNVKIAAFPPKSQSLSFNSPKPHFSEDDLIDRLKDDFDSQPDFHCHMFGLGGRGRSSSMHLSPPAPFLSKSNHYT